MAGRDASGNKATARRAEALLLQVCRAVDKAMAGRVQQWIGVGTVGHLTGIDFEQLDLAIIACKERGWLSTGGNPVHSVLLTAAGRLAIKG